ncbi:CaiB/BaiF CoA transferase family protein [Candidatus Pelagibacter sp. HIMB1517]|uniref:CaiB/BaiF CoA transferase family protein n=2 Tax=Candidatus Pelagibacter sp. HIMB1517 TaxID=3413341 RepID=UPI003F879ACE
MNKGPLSGLLVLDLTRVLVGPYCTMILSDLGARVIKVEAPGVGDDSRGFGPFIEDQSAYFMSLNRNKESIALNLKVEEDKKIFEKILDKTDILVENFKPGTLTKWGYGWENLKDKYPKLIYASASGFGQTGPLKELPAYDMVVQGMGGLMSVTGQPNSEPTRVGTSIGDITAGLFTAIGINAALYDRQKTGKGMYIDVSMLDCQIAILENAIARYLSKGEIPKPMGSRHPSISPFEAFKTKDSYIIIAAGNDKLFEGMCKVFDLELYKDAKFKTNADRNKNIEELKKILEEKLKDKTTSEWCKVLEAKRIPCGPINNIKEAVESPQTKARNMIVSAMHNKIGEFKMAGNPIKMSSYEDKNTRGEIPNLDQHREKILKEFGT